MIDISQIVSGGTAPANAPRNPQPASGASEFGDALARARQTQAGEASAASQQPSAAKSGKAADGAGKQAADTGKKADPAGADADAGKTQASTGKAEGATEGRKDSTDLADDETGTNDGAAAAAAAALLAAMLPAAPAAAAAAAAAAAGTGPAVGTAMPAAANAAIAGQLPAAATAPEAASSLAEDTLNTIASQRAALATTTAAPDAAAAKPATPADADAGKPAVSFDAAAKSALSVAQGQASTDTGGKHDGTGGGRDGAASQFAAPAQQPAAAASSTTASPTAALQAALQAASAAAKAPGEDNGAVAAPIEGTTPLAHGTTTTLGAQSGSQAPATLPLAPRVGDPQWPQALGQQMVRLTTQGNHTAELQLNPPDLGPLKVVLNVVNDQAQAQFVSPHASVRAAVEAALPQLRHAMADSGIQLGHTSVGAEQFAGQPGQGQQQAPQHRGQGFAQGMPEFQQPGATQTATAPAAPRRVALGEVDTFA
ncbi:flagellar hook-length control protein FliK [Cupriavidus gilardii]|uniref:flagellar hook-length control protein FliK n=1 Tax=Cupriavidus gilardii TaxID=82541 RepID=UPI001573DC4E|nr:flagellar hook-length control protein FliK [Cupriavidus gilardii]NSX04172.1 flagellar hook-length control protein FliK [Cupriavidus gilardii]